MPNLEPEILKGASASTSSSSKGLGGHSAAGGAGRVEEVVAGLQAGTCFSLSALACKIGFILGRGASGRSASVEGTLIALNPKP